MNSERMKQFISLLLAGSMALGLLLPGVSAFAEDGDEQPSSEPSVAQALVEKITEAAAAAAQNESPPTPETPSQPDTPPQGDPEPLSESPGEPPAPHEGTDPEPDAPGVTEDPAQPEPPREEEPATPAPPEEEKPPEEPTPAEQKEKEQELEEARAHRSDPAADVEIPSEWAAMFEKLDLTGKYPDDLLAVARTQIGYTESEANYAEADGQRRGYTRYGAWNQDPYAPWNLTFVAFCLEYAQVRFDGQVKCEEARKIVSRTVERDAHPFRDDEQETPAHMVRYDIEAMRYEDHMMLRISDARQTREFIVALPDSSRFAYVSITGERCVVRGIRVDQDEASIGPDVIPRIAEEISFIRDCPQGDIPNVQINRWRSASSEGVPVTADMRLTFHAMSLPTARLIWHCPFVCVFTAKDRKVGGEGFHEYTLIRLDGENWESDERAENNVIINHTADFAGWNDWKARFRQGLDCEVSIRREGNRITVTTENLGVAIKGVTTLLDGEDEVYVALTGDQCAITDIHIENRGE